MEAESLKLPHRSRGKEACRNGNGRTGGEAGVESSPPIVPTSAACVEVNVKEMEGYLSQTILFFCWVYLRLSQAFPVTCCPPPLISEEGGGESYLLCGWPQLPEHSQRKAVASPPFRGTWPVAELGNQERLLLGPLGFCCLGFKDRKGRGAG